MLNPKERRRSVFAAARRVDLWSVLAVGLAALCVIIGGIVLVVNPGEFSQLRDFIMVLVLPVIGGLIALSQKAYGTVVNGQLGLLLRTEGEKAEAKVEAAHHAGKLEGVKEAPAILKGEG